MVREADDRPTRAQACDRRGRPSGEGGDEQRRGPERLGDVAGGVRHRLADRGLLLRLRDLVPVAEAGLDRAGDAVHVGDRFEREIAHRRLAGQHQRARTVEDGVGDVGRLCARRLGRVDHRLEHLRRRNNRLPPFERAVNDPLLQQRHLGRTDLDAEVAARDHDRVRLAEDVVEHRDRFRLLDLRDHVRGRARGLDQRLQRLHVGGRADKGERDEVDAELERELEIVDVLARERGDRQRHAWQVDPLVRGDGAADEHLAACAATVDRGDAEPHGAVVDQHVETGLEHGAEDGRRDRQVVAAGGILAGDRQLFAALEHDRLRELADAELRALEVGDQRDRPADLLLQAADQLRTRPVILVRAVREVETGAVDGAHELLERHGIRRRRPDRGDDLRAARGEGHGREPIPAAPWGTPTTRGRPPALPVRPRSGLGGCTSPYGRTGPGRRS